MWRTNGTTVVKAGAVCVGVGALLLVAMVPREGARTASAVSGLRDVSVHLIEWMTVLAMGLGLIQGRQASCAPKNVVPLAYWKQVVRVHARRIVAEVVQHQARRYRPDEKGVRQAVCSPPPTYTAADSPGSSAVPVGAAPSLPFPTLSWRDENSLHQPFNIGRRRPQWVTMSPLDVVVEFADPVRVKRHGAVRQSACDRVEQPARAHLSHGVIVVDHAASCERLR